MGHKALHTKAEPQVRAQMSTCDTVAEPGPGPGPVDAEAGGLGSHVWQVQPGCHSTLRAPWQKPPQVRGGHSCAHCSWPAPTKVTASVSCDQE